MFLLKTNNRNLKLRIFILVFFSVNLFLSSYFLDIWPTPNPVSRALPVLAFSKTGTLQIDNYAGETMDKSKVGNHFYSDKAPLPTILTIPFYELFKFVGFDKVDNDAGRKFPIYIWRPNGLDDGRITIINDIIPVLLIGDFLYSSIPFVLIILITFLALHKINTKISPVLLAMLSFYGSFIFVFAGTFFSHVFAGFLLLISYIELKKTKYFLSGLFLGLSFLSEYTVLLAAFIWGVLILIKEKKIKKILFFGLGILPSVFLILLYNWQISGEPFTMLNAFHADEAYKQLSQNYGFSFPSFPSIWGLSFSGSMGIFIFAPVIIIIGFYFVTKLIKEKHFIKLILTNYLVIFSIIFFLIIASFFTWWGGWTYGPRYLIVLAIVLLYEGLLFVSKSKLCMIACLVVSVAGLISAWFAKSTLVYMVPDYFLDNEKYSNTLFNILFPEFKEGRFNANNFLSVSFNIEPEFGAYLWLLLFVISTIGLYFWYRYMFPNVRSQALL